MAYMSQNNFDMVVFTIVVFTILVCLGYGKLEKK